MSKGYTIRLFVPDGEPDKFKIITKMNWTGAGLELARDAWQTYKSRKEFDEAGIYILVGYEGDDLPTIYVGQGDGVKQRIESHAKNKDFWDRALVFVSTNGGLNRAHITWLEWALIQRAIRTKRCNLDNSATPNEPALTESEKADTEEFLSEMLSILPLVDVKIFEDAKIIKVEEQSTARTRVIEDTIVVPAQEEGFNAVFIGENSWYAIRIGGGHLDKIKYIAAYQTAPTSAITHAAEVDSIEPYGDGGKYRLNFKGPAKPIGPVLMGDAKRGSMQSSRYTNYQKLLEAKTLTDLFKA
ncbi:GIY-YIG nuclease family protein [Verrucomicrobia bacterium]|nr:GIY-YIG nuclease family protein [Verrucomicrobiota bacterium]